jgi:hypothetical protein
LSTGVAVDGLGRGVGDDELELAAGRACQLEAALDGDLWVVDTEPLAADVGRSSREENS